MYYNKYINASIDYNLANYQTKKAQLLNKNVDGKLHNIISNILNKYTYLQLNNI